MNPIVNAFEHAAETYVNACSVQRRIAKHLADRFVDSKASHSAPKRILELGCGTGALTGLLAERFPSSQIMATDASPAMISVARKRVEQSNVQFQTLLIDGQTPDGDMPAASEQMAGRFDLIASSMALHWVADFENVLQRIAEQADKIIFSIPVLGTFENWIKAHEAVGLTHGVRNFVSEEKVRSWQTFFSHHSYSVEFLDFWESYADPFDFVRQLKQVGASLPREGHQPVKNLRNVFKQFPNGIKINYRMAFVQAFKPNCSPVSAHS